MKQILIVGANSYIGESVKDYLKQSPEDYSVSILDAKGLILHPGLFNNIDVVLCVVGIAHVKESNRTRKLFYDVNRDLVVSIAKASKSAGVKQFILLSSMSVYGLKEGYITKTTIPTPTSSYGDSKLQADMIIKSLEDDSFYFVCLRPPMVYGKGCKGNYQRLRVFALKSPVFPSFNNLRSMIYIGNLCEFIKICIDEEKRGLFFPQNDEFINTSDLVEKIAQAHGKTIHLTKRFNGLLNTSQLSVVKKVFGNLMYEQVDVIGKYSFQESIWLTENNC